ncbi:MAG: flippase [Phascolarctobacterium sp.]|nr:flippase [Candidatus Phascolarctobacterium caballi]
MFGNIIFNVLNRILAIVTPCITIPYLARTLGADGLGLYSYNLSWATYFTCFINFGVSLYGIRQVAYVRNKGKDAYSKVFWELFFMRLGLAVLASVLYYFVFVQNSVNYFLNLILLFDIVSSFFEIEWLYGGLEQFRIVFVRNFFVRAFSVCAIFLFVKSHEDVLIYALILTCNKVLGYLIMWVPLKNLIAIHSFGNINFLQHFVPALMLYIPQIAIEVYTVLDKTMLGYLLQNNFENGYYDQAHKVILILLSVITAIAPVMMARVANLNSGNAKDNIVGHLEYSFRFVWMLALPMIVGIFFVADVFVPIFFGNGYDKVVDLLKIFSLLTVIIGISNTLGIQYLVSVGKEKYLTYSVLAGAITNFCLNLYLIPHYASKGAVVASVFAEMVVTSVQMLCVYKELPLLKYFKTMSKYLLATVVMGLVLYFMPLLGDSYFSKFLQQTCVGIIIYAVVLLLVKDKLAWMFVNKIKSVIAL